MDCPEAGLAHRIEKMVAGLSGTKTKPTKQKLKHVQTRRSIGSVGHVSEEEEVRCGWDVDTAGIGQEMGCSGTSGGRITTDHVLPTKDLDLT